MLIILITGCGSHQKNLTDCPVSEYEPTEHMMNYPLALFSSDLVLDALVFPSGVQPGYAIEKEGQQEWYTIYSIWEDTAMPPFLDFDLTQFYSDYGTGTYRVIMRDAADSSIVYAREIILYSADGIEAGRSLKDVMSLRIEDITQITLKDSQYQEIQLSEQEEQELLTDFFSLPCVSELEESNVKMGSDSLGVTVTVQLKNGIALQFYSSLGTDESGKKIYNLGCHYGSGIITLYDAEGVWIELSSTLFK